MNNVFEISVYLAGSFIFAAITYTALNFYFVNKKLATYVLELSSKLEALQKKTKELMEQTESKSLEQTDAFVRFVSQSREKAFEYIEDVQASLYELKDVRAASQDDLEAIRNAVDKILTHLPEDFKND
jgi:acetyl-CoA carboxylase alpha subunit